MGAVVAMLAVVAIADYFFQYRQWFERQKMSLQEMKEEFKQSEGDPHIKGRIRQLRQAAHEEAHDGRGSQGLGDHHQPDPLRGGAELRTRHVGADLRSQGHRHASRSRSGKSRANTTSRSWRTCRWRVRCMPTVDIDDEIPVEHYHAVAEVIGYVMGLKRGLSSRRV